MRKIQCLDPHVADLIAAGEVVERPGAVVKELMENAIDAGATAMTVEIVRGGMQMVRVTDNGSGIVEEDVTTAFLRHATSKIQTENDLEAIGTLGFRGEALAAIAAVSRVELRTRTEQAETGCLLLLEGGVVGELAPIGAPKGTTIIVRNLFYNTPARQKFIKKDTAEGMYAYHIVQKIALSHPEISISFIRDGKEELHTPGDGILESAVYAVLGRDIALHLCPVHAVWEDCSIDGFVSQPSSCRGTRGQQHFFVNGRFVKSRLMMAALEEAYKNQAMVGKFPACILHITVKPSAVDVNVHPTKTEVKFVRERRLFDALYHSVLGALQEGSVHPTMEFDLKVRETEESVPPATKVPFSAQEGVGRPLPSAMQQGQTDHISPAFPSSKKEGDWNWVADGLRVPYRHEIPQPASRPEELVPDIQIAIPHVEQPVALSAAASPPDSVQKDVCSDPEENQTKTEKESFRLVGEVFDTYLIVAVGQRMLVIDKHAAHERMQFDRLKVEGYRVMSQTLLKPIVFSIQGEAEGVLLQNLGLLSEFGFEVEAFGENCLIVRGIPFDLEPGQAEDTLLELAEALLQGKRVDPQGVRDQMLRTMACKMAIKGGQKNTMQELMVVAEAVVNGQVKFCPHGRPVAIEMTSQELEKQFKRS